MRYLKGAGRICAVAVPVLDFHREVEKVCSRLHTPGTHKRKAQRSRVGAALGWKGSREAAGNGCFVLDPQDPLNANE